MLTIRTLDDLRVLITDEGDLITEGDISIYCDVPDGVVQHIITGGGDLA